MNKNRLLLVAAIFFMAVSVFVVSGCGDLSELLTPTTIDRDEFKPVCKKSLKGKTIYIDFKTASYWYHRYASDLAYTIKDRLIEDVVEDGCFKVQDTYQYRKKYAYKVSVRIANPKIKVSKNGVIKRISATYRIKTYDNRENLIKAKTRDVTYNSPMLTVAVNDSQNELLNNYAYNASVEIRKAVYDSVGMKTASSSQSGGKYKTSAAVNMRSAATTKSKIIRKLSKNTAVNPTGQKKGKWWQVTVKGKKGWVHSNYIH